MAQVSYQCCQKLGIQPHSRIQAGFQTGTYLQQSQYTETFYVNDFKFYNKISIFLPVLPEIRHSATQQNSSWCSNREVSPIESVHSVPPYCGAGSEQERVLFLYPQSLQAPHAVQSVHTPSTVGQIKLLIQIHMIR